MSPPYLTPIPGSETTGSEDLVIVGCCADKVATDLPLPALDLYNGGCVPPLRQRVGHRAGLRARVRFLSAQHGLISASTPLLPYDRPLDPKRATQLRPTVWAALRADVATTGMPDRVLVVAEPLYLVLLADLLAEPSRPRSIWIPDHAGGWPDAAAVLDEWGW